MNNNQCGQQDSKQAPVNVLAEYKRHANGC